MKERIVIEKELLEKIIKASPVQWFDNKEKTDKLVLFGKEYKVEKYPTSWEELKELCKELEPKLVKENNLYETQITLNINGGYYAFYPDGTIIFKASNSINYTIAENKTMFQMFQFIKSIIGEEK